MIRRVQLAPAAQCSTAEHDHVGALIVLTLRNPTYVADLAAALRFRYGRLELERLKAEGGDEAS